VAKKCFIVNSQIGNANAILVAHYAYGGLKSMSVIGNTAFQFFWRDRSVHKDFRTGVSLHSHTMYSEESLAMISRSTASVPFVGHAIRKLEAQNESLGDRSRFRQTDRVLARTLDSRRSVWTPPLSPSRAYCIEQRQIQRQFQLPALVSITDHDDIQAAKLLHVLDPFESVPISTEWSMPFGPTFFHLGIHNMPGSDCTGIMEQLRCFAADPGIAKLENTLAMLNSYPDVLLVLNHPLWDEKGIGRASHAQVLGDMLHRYRLYFHALEVNGFRTWDENQAVIKLGQEIGMPIVSGGDRHGCEPNAILNLSHAANLPEFIQEIRYRGVSHVVFMPQYSRPLKLRIFQTILDVIRDHPENLEGRRHLSDRLLFRDSDSAHPVPLKCMWSPDAQKNLGPFFSAIRLLADRHVRSVLRLAFHASYEYFDQEIAA
jgi:hypothetical protein